MTFAQPFSDYEILDRVGAGAMGTVFKARQKKLNRIVALKVLKPSLARDERYVDRLRREARIVASLNDPHIVTGYDLGEEGGYHFFVMEFVEGKSLRALLVEWGMFAEEYVLKVAQQVAQALDHAYQRGVIHRDVKPGNILIDEHGVVKLTDMGLAKGPADMTLTRDGATVGTPQYISPEQARNPQDVDVRSDLYSLGATLYHMATGVPPFRGDTMAELITKVLHDAPVSPNEINPALSEGMSLVIRKLLAKDLRVRYQTPRELLSDLDRLQRSLPPEVDPERLSAQEDRRANLLVRSLAVVATAGLLGGAVWVGMQFHAEPASVPAGDRFVADLDAALHGLPTPGEQLLRLRALKAAAPPGSERELQAHERRIMTALQAAVDTTAASFLDEDRDQVMAWLRDPAIWPDSARFQLERLLPRLRQKTGLSYEQLREVVRMDRLDALAKAIDGELRTRDAELLRRLDEFLTETLPVQVEERLRACDFAGAERLWVDSLRNFTHIARVPLEERMGEATLRKARELRDQARERARAGIDVQEELVAKALRSGAVAVLTHLRERLAMGAPPEEIEAAQQNLRRDLLQTWPSSSRFRTGRGFDPWPEIERQNDELVHAIQLAQAEADDVRWVRRCDLAWRAVCQGRAADGLQMLHGMVPPTSRQASLMAKHERALQAAAAVEQAVMGAIARSPTPVPAFLRSGTGYAVSLRVESDAGEPQLWSQETGRPARRAVLSEFRFGDLMQQLGQVVPDPLAGLSRDDANVGVLVMKMIGDEFAGVAPRLRESGDEFLLDQVWPRIQQVRSEHEETVQDRGALFAKLTAAHHEAMQTWDLHELEAAIHTCELRVPLEQMSDAEHAAFRAARTWFRLALRRDNVLDDARNGAPKGAKVDVDIDGEEIRSSVSVSAPNLLPGAAGGWLLRDDQLEFGGGNQPWSELPQLQLQCASGIQGNTPQSTLVLDCTLPPSVVGRRLYAIEFRGISIVLVVAGDDGVHAALVEGDVRREDAAQRAFQRAIEGVLSGSPVIAIPGAVHRIEVDVRASQIGRRARVRVRFEGTEVLDAVSPLDPEKPVSMVLFPRQEIGVRTVVMRSSGL